ncbi:MAG: transposase family protein [Anaerolineales bacterium]|nr:transposase family protein [Anaerolineales bacterium]
MSTIKISTMALLAHVFDQTKLIALVTQTLKRAQQKKRSLMDLSSSDQGTQYTSQAYHVLVGEYNITPSMSRRGNCWDNAPMENFFGHLKEEYLRQFKQTTFRIQSNLLMNTFTFTTMNGYNWKQDRHLTKRCLSI